MKYDAPKRLGVVVAALGLLAPAWLFGQSAPANQTATPAEKPQEEIYTLNVFQVDATRDRGYRATNSISGTRLNTPIKDLPMPVEVFTKDFLSDIGSIDVKEALQYSAGATLETVQSSTNFLFSPSPVAFDRSSSAFRLRGFATRTQLRNGFITQSTPDSALVERVEIVRGPSALLYGVSVLGGVVNSLTKAPTETPRYEIKGLVGNYDFYRTEIDLSGPVPFVGKGVLGYRIAGVFQDAGDWTDHLTTKRKIINPSLAFKPFKGTTVNADVEFFDLKTEGNAFQDLEDTTDPVFLNQFGISTRNNIYNESKKVARDVFGKGPDFRWSGPDAFTRSKGYTATADLMQEIGDSLVVRAGVSYSDFDNTQLQFGNFSVQRNNNGVPAEFRTPQADGSFKALQYAWNRNPSAIERLQARVEAAYTTNLFGGQHTLLVGRQDAQSTTLENQLANASTFFKRYDDLTPFTYAGDTFRNFRDRQFQEWNTGHYVVYSGKLWKDRLYPIAGIRFDRYHVRDLYWTYQRIDPAGSATDPANWRRPDNYDDLTGVNPNGTGIFNNTGANASTVANNPPGETPRVAGYRFGGKVQREDSPTLGLSYKINDAFSIYALSATGLFPNTGQRMGDGTPFKAESTESKEIGLKVDLWGGRVSGTIAAFRIDRDNAVFNFPFAPASRNNNTGTNLGLINSNRFQTNVATSYWVPAGYYQSGQLTAAEVTAGGRTVIYDNLGNSPVDRAAIDAAFAARDFQLYNNNLSNNPSENRNSDVPISDRTEGFDLQLNIQLRTNWALILNYAYLQQEITESFQLTGETRATEYDVWAMQLGRDNFADPKRPETYRGQQAVGVRIIDDPEHAARAFTNYTFTSGGLKGFNLGGGLIYDGKRQSSVAITNGGVNAARVTPDLPSRLTANLVLGYNRKIGATNWRFQLNVSNLFDDQKDESFNTSTVYVNSTGTSVSATPGTGLVEQVVPNRAFRYYAPRTFRLSASVQF
ncbi:MAG TPA: TonB-dependent receptor plug domain-containing protein [Acidobacteriota bacterium]|nr:TonB-dependent receptor plug domain-containing protein [Acidobacteriota bacterium]